MTDWIVNPFVLTWTWAGSYSWSAGGQHSEGGQPSHTDPAPFAQRLVTLALQGQSVDLAGLNCW